MTQDGYRLFVVSLHDGQRRAEQLFEAAKAQPKEGESKPSAIDYLDTAASYIAKHVNETCNLGVPDKVDPADDDGNAAETRGSSTRLLKSKRTSRSLRMWFSSGPVNWDGISADPSGATSDVELRGRSTLHDFRATLVISPGATRAILAVEARGRSCPYVPLKEALKRWSPVPWRLKVHENVADSAAVTKFINDAEIQHVDLTEWSFDSDGGKIARNHTLSARVDKVATADKAKAFVTKWAKKGKEESAEQVLEEAKAVKGSFFSMKVDIPFNDVAITLKAGSQQRTLKPSTDYRRFTYFLGDSIVSDDEFFFPAEATALELIKNVQIVAEDG